MILRLLPVTVIVAAVGWWATTAHTAGPTTAPVPPASPPENREPPEFEVRMADGSRFRAVLLDPTVTLSTRYGKLVIPAPEIRRIEPGLRYLDGVEARITRAVEDLGSPAFAAREEAEKLLLGFEHTAIPALRRAVRSPNPEVSRRAITLLKQLAEKLPPDRMTVRDYDVVETSEFTARGQVEGGRLKVRTRYFGEAVLLLAEVRGLRSVSETTATDVEVDASMYAKQNPQNWLETKVEVVDGQSIEITATGQIDLHPAVLGGQFTTGPNGHPGANSAGQLLGRIGPNGNVFVIGASHKGRVSGTGKLFLRMSQSPWNNDPTGSFHVRIAPGD